MTRKEKIDTVSRQILAVANANGEVKLADYAATHDDNGVLGVWVHTINRNLKANHGVVLRKSHDTYKVLDVDGSIKRADRHGVKMRRQATYRKETLEGLLARTDLNNDERSKVARKRDKAADTEVTLHTLARKKKRSMVECYS